MEINVELEIVSSLKQYGAAALRDNCYSVTVRSSVVNPVLREGMFFFFLL